MRYAAVGMAAALAVLGGSFVYRMQSPPAPMILHGSPGVKHTPDGAAIRWRTRKTTVYIDSSVDKLGPKAREAIRRAFGTWLGDAAHLPELTFDTIDGTKARLQADGKNTIVLAPITIENHERDLAITVMYSDEKSGDVLEADVVINAAYPFDLLDASREDARMRETAAVQTAGHPLPPNDTGAAPQRTDAPNANGRSSEPGAVVTIDPSLRAERHSSCVVRESDPTCGREVYDLENVLAHEAGHFFGLGEDMTDTSATMFLCTNRCETHKRQPTASDQAAIAALYVQPLDPDEDRDVGCGGARLAAGTRLPPDTFFAALFVAAILVARRRSRRT